MILVTGSAGFIGSHLVKALPEGNVITADPRHGPQRTVETIIADPVSRIEAIFHLGAISDTTCTDAKALEETNVRLTLRLGKFCRERMIPFIYASSAAVYGNGSGPLNAYALSKLQADELLARQGGILLHYTYGLRFFNVYGPGEEHKGEQRSMVSKAIDAYRDGEQPRFYDLEAKRDFVHVRDVVDAMLWFWKERPRSGTYDIGTGHPRSIEEMCDIVQKAMGISHFPVETGVPAELKGKLQTYTRANVGPLFGIGYAPRRYLTLEEGVLQMLHRPKGS